MLQRHLPAGVDNIWQKNVELISTLISNIDHKLRSLSHIWDRSIIIKESVPPTMTSLVGLKYFLHKN